MKVLHLIINHLSEEEKKKFKEQCQGKIWELFIGMKFYCDENHSYSKLFLSTCYYRMVACKTCFYITCKFYDNLILFNVLKRFRVTDDCSDDRVDNVCCEALIPGFKSRFDQTLSL